MKLRKILAMVLCVAMVLSTMSFNVFAETSSALTLPEDVTADSFGENTVLAVIDGTATYYATMKEALNTLKSNEALKGLELTLYCKPNANVGAMSHEHIHYSSLTVYGNGASVETGGDQDFAVDTYKCDGTIGSCLAEDVTLTVYNLENFAVWGQRTSEYSVNINLTDCVDINRVYISGTSGNNNITINGCTFVENAEISNDSCAVYSNANGAVSIVDCTFTNVLQPVNLNHKVAGEQNIEVKNSVFTGCGDSSANYAAPVRVLSSVEGATSKLTVQNCTFTDSVANSLNQEADILLDYGVGTATASISDTEATVAVEKETDNAEYTNVERTDSLAVANYATWEGETISSLEDLKAFRDAVNAGDAFEGKTITLADNIDLSSESDWTPIGNGSRNGSSYTGDSFKGTFDGAGYTISGLTITSDNSADCAGLFGVLDGANIKDINLTDVSIDSAYENAGALAGLAVNGGEVSSITVSGEVAAVDGAGGVIGRITISGTVSDCVNNAEVTGAAAGGIVGKAYYTGANLEVNISDCINNGTITSSASGCAGGIVGFSSANVSDCSNKGNITANTAAGINLGGIVGWQQMYGEISGNTNSGFVGSETYVTTAGGIVGWVNYQYPTDGSSAAYPAYEIVSVNGNTNTASIIAPESALGSGGIVGGVYNAIYVKNNVNRADEINGGAFASGIVGNYQNSDANGYNGNNKVLEVVDNTTYTKIGSITATCVNIICYDNVSSADFTSTNTVFETEPAGNDFTGYTNETGIWGEVWGNAKKSFVIKVLDADDNVMGTTSLNNIDGIIDGDVTVTWNLKLDAESNTDEYWTMEWITAPSAANVPAKVELWVDGVRVSGGNVVLSGPDNLYPVFAAITDDEGKILSYVRHLYNEDPSAALSSAIEQSQNGVTVLLLDDISLGKTVHIPNGKKVTLDLAGYTIDFSDDWVYGADNSGTAVITVNYGGELTVDDSSKEKTGKINGYDETATIAAYRLYGAIMMTVKGDNAENGPAKLTVNGGTIIGTFAAIAGNRSRDNTEIVVNEGSVIGPVSDKYSSAGIEHAQNGKLTINGGYIEGMDAVSMRSGDLVITGGTLKGTAPETAFDDDGYWNNNFAACTGHALQIVSRESAEATQETPSVSITGGTFSADSTAAIGSYAAAGDTQIVKFITGGSFSSDVSAYLAEGLSMPYNSITGLYGVSASWTMKANADDNEVYAGDKVQITINASGDNFTAADWKLNYESDKFKFVRIVTDLTYEDVHEEAGSYISGVVMNPQSKDEYTSDTVLAVYEFEAIALTSEVEGAFTLTDASVGTAEMSIASYPAAATEGDKVKILLKDFSVSVKYNGEDVVGNKVEVPYDGNEHKIDVATEPSATVQYSTDGGATWTTEVPTFTEYGEHKFMYNVDVPAGYDPTATNPVTITVNITEPEKVVEVTTYAGDYKLVLVYTDVDGVYFTYGDNSTLMLDVTAAGYKYTDAEGNVSDHQYKKVYGYVVPAEMIDASTYADASVYASKVKFANGTAKTPTVVTSYDYNVNCDPEAATVADLADVVYTQSVYNTIDSSMMEKYMKAILKADVNRADDNAKKVDGSDVADVKTDYTNNR